MSISPGWLTKEQSPFHPPCRHSKLPRLLPPPCLEAEAASLALP